MGLICPSPLHHHVFPRAKLVNAYLQPRILNFNLPMLIWAVRLLSFPPVPLQHALPRRRQQAKLLQILRHRIMHFPPPCVSNITCIFPPCIRIPIAVVVAKTLPRLEAQVVKRIQNRRISTKQEFECAIRRLYDHHARIEQRAIIHCCGYLWHLEQEVYVSENQYISIHENDPVVVRELP